jgi:uncharacterized protein (DUF302 family)
MKYFSSKIIHEPDFNAAKEKVVNALQSEGFGVLTEIDIQATMKKKLDKDYLPHLILGACNPVFADQVLQQEPNISVLLPCNVTLRQLESGEIEVAAIDPVAAMAAVENSRIQPLAVEVQSRLNKVIEKL